MIDPPSILELEKRMRPGAYSSGGFLGRTESLEAVLAQDSQTLAKLGISHMEIADALDSILQRVEDQRRKLLFTNYEEYRRREGLPQITERTRRGQERVLELSYPGPIPHFSMDNLPSTDTGYLVDDKFQVFIHQYRGIQECPWGCAAGSSFDFLIVNRQSGKSIAGPGLIVHLIREHHFFEGQESPYRVDPIRLVQVLELVSKVGVG